MTAPAEGDGAIAAVAEVLDCVKHAEATLAAARRRVGSALARLSGGPDAEPPPLAAALSSSESAPAERIRTLRERIVAAVEASPDEVFTTARVARAVGHGNRDSVRNTLLVLAAKGQIDKLGEGQYQARRREATALEGGPT